MGPCVIRYSTYCSRVKCYRATSCGHAHIPCGQPRARILCGQPHARIPCGQPHARILCGKSARPQGGNLMPIYCVGNGATSCSPCPYTVWADYCGTEVGQWDSEVRTWETVCPTIPNDVLKERLVVVPSPTKLSQTKLLLLTSIFFICALDFVESSQQECHVNAYLPASCRASHFSIWLGIH